MAKNKDQDQKERLPFNIVKDSQNLLRVTVDGVSKKYSRIPKRLRSSFVIVVGIFAIVIIAVFANQQETPQVEPESLETQSKPLSRLTDIIINENNEFQVKVPEAPKVTLEGNVATLVSEVKEVSASGTGRVTATAPTESTSKPQQLLREATKPDIKKNQQTELEDFKMIYPLRRQGAIVTDYGWYHHPLLELWRYHQGVDIRCKKGDLVMAVAPGKVTDITENDHEAIMITIEHPEGWVTQYGQVGETSVRIGQQVSKGEQIGYTGQSSTAYEPHLHFQILHDGESINPGKYLP